MKVLRRVIGSGLRSKVRSSCCCRWSLNHDALKLFMMLIIIFEHGLYSGLHFNIWLLTKTPLVNSGLELDLRNLVGLLLLMSLGEMRLMLMDLAIMVSLDWRLSLNLCVVVVSGNLRGGRGFGALRQRWHLLDVSLHLGKLILELTLELILKVVIP